MTGPNVIVLPSREAPGAPNPEAETRTPLALEVALARSWQTDAHFALYQVPSEEEWPRLNKEILSELPEGSVTLAVTCLDWDTAGHQPLTPADLVLIDKALEANPDLAPSWWHPTQNGVRFIYWHDPVQPGDGEAFHRGLVEAWAARGLLFDSGTWEWNRIFRLPNVVRDDTPLVAQVHGTGSLFDHTRIPRVAHRRALSTVTLRLPQPSPSFPDPLLWRPKASGNGVKLTSWGIEAKRRLKGRMEGRLHDLFDPNPPPVPNPRNETLMRWIGSATSLLHGALEGTTPEHLYALFAPAAQQSLRPNDRDLLAETWKMILYCWAREEAALAAAQLDQQEASASLLDAPGLPFSTTEDLLSNLVVSIGRDYYVLHQDGYYRGPHLREHLYSALRDSGLCPAILTLEVPSPNGSRPLRTQEILERHHTPLQGRVRRKPGPNGVAKIDGQDLVVGSFQRNPALTPRWDPDVDKWFRSFAGPHYDTLSRWIGLALAFERGPICALSITAPPGIGKKLLVKGLAECISPPTFSTAGVFGNWQYGLDESPFLVINEGWPSTRDPIDVMFRKLVSGDTIEIKKKYQQDVLVEVAPRVILTANNRRMVEKLFGRDCDELDQKAIADRLLHLELKTGARDLFEGEDPGWCDGWISGGQFEKSDYRVARHFLTFYERYKDTRSDGRFLMQGRTTDALITRLTTSEGLPADVAEVLCDLYSRDLLTRVTREQHLWVTSHQVRGELEFKVRGQLPSLNKVGRLIAPFRSPRGPRVHTDKNGNSSAGHALNEDKIRTLAQELGYSTPTPKAKKELNV